MCAAPANTCSGRLQDEAAVLCLLGLLRRFNVSDGMVAIEDFFACGAAEVDAFVNRSTGRPRHHPFALDSPALGYPPPPHQPHQPPPPPPHPRGMY